MQNYKLLSTMGGITGYIIPIISLSFILVFCIIVVVKASKLKKRIKQCNEDLSNKDTTCVAFLPHISGLPLARNSTCQIFSVPDNIRIYAVKNKFTLSKSKISDIAITNDADIQKLIFTYQKDETVAHIAFDATDDLDSAQKFVDEFKDGHIVLNEQIDL